MSYDEEPRKRKAWADQVIQEAEADTHYTCRFCGSRHPTGLTCQQAVLKLVTQMEAVKGINRTLSATVKVLTGRLTETTRLLVEAQRLLEAEVDDDGVEGGGVCDQG